ncbi:MAG TPA: hypothetical protein VFW94_23720 [Candidatus Acidoferrales bacterium]|nr:hypothetical protein [Candidatus Acidoferrales bacterium]
MRRLFCESCVNPYAGTSARANTSIVFADASKEIFPLEKTRVVYGTAKLPMAAQRVVLVNGAAKPLESAHYDCDGCGKGIYPGELCAALSAWRDDGRGEMGEWETEYLNPLSQEEYKRIVGVNRRLQGK